MSIRNLLSRADSADVELSEEELRPSPEDTRPYLERQLEKTNMAVSTLEAKHAGMQDALDDLRADFQKREAQLIKQMNEIGVSIDAFSKAAKVFREAMTDDSAENVISSAELIKRTEGSESAISTANRFA